MKPGSISSLPFLERDLELQTLARWYDPDHGRDRARFLLLYGHQGVGKTRLLAHFLETQAIQNAFYWQVPAGDAQTQLYDFSQALQRYVAAGDPGATEAEPNFSWRDWEAALEQLAQLTDPSTSGQALQVCILEDFPALCHQDRAVSSIFQKMWDLRLQHIPQLRLVLTGGVISTILREVLAYSAPLYLRATHQIALWPLRYTAVLDLFPNHTPEERLAIWAITGGMPAYLVPFSHNATIHKGIEELCFAPESTFLADVQNLFGERLAELALSQAIIAAVATDINEVAGLSQQLGVAEEQLEQPLGFLEWSHLLAPQRSVLDNPFSRHIRFELSESPLHFYHQHVKPYLAQRLEPAAATQAIAASVRYSLPENPFTKLCWEWVWAAVATKQIEMVPQQVGAFWDEANQSAEFAVAAVDPWQKRVLLGQTVWPDDTNPTLVTTGVAVEKLVASSRQTPQMPAGWTVQLVLFGRSAFPEAVRRAADEAGVRLVTLEEIEALLPAARAELRWQWANPQHEEIEF
jgi:hypothetical protein